MGTQFTTSPTRNLLHHHFLHHLPSKFAAVVIPAQLWSSRRLSGERWKNLNFTPSNRRPGHAGDGIDWHRISQHVCLCVMEIVHIVIKIIPASFDSCHCMHARKTVLLSFITRTRTSPNIHISRRIATNIVYMFTCPNHRP